MKYIKNVLGNLDINNNTQAAIVRTLVPSTCPFARTIVLGKYKLVIPPLCKINPLYEELMMLRFKADCYIADMQES